MEGCNVQDKHKMMEYHTLTNYFVSVWVLRLFETSCYEVF